jgi:hypothetical protein
MSQTMALEEFLDWMVNIDKMHLGPAKVYAKAINKISQHYSENKGKQVDIYGINDISNLKNIEKEYRRGGSYENFGDLSRGLYRCAITKYVKFVTRKNIIPPSPKETPISQLISEDKLYVINKAFRLILPVLAKYIGKILIEKDQINWWSKYVRNKLKNENTIRKLPEKGSGEECIESLDIPACLNIIECNWVEVFKNKMDDRQRTWAHALYDIRNYYESHYTTKTINTISVEDISLELAIMIRFMHPIDTYISNQISTIKKNLESK